MEAYLIKIGDRFLAYIPPVGDMFALSAIESEESIKTFYSFIRENSLELFSYCSLPKSILQNKKKILGNICTYKGEKMFKINGIEYTPSEEKQDNILLSEQICKFLIEGEILPIPLSERLADKIAKKGKEEKTLNSIPNGFTICQKYLIFYKKNKKGELYNPQLKTYIKSKNK